MSDFMQQPLDAAASLAPTWLADIHARGKAVWQNTPMPTRKTEAWKYTNLLPLQQRFQAPDKSNTPEVSGINYPQLGGSTLVFVDGFYREELSKIDLPEGARLLRFAEADSKQAEAIRARLGQAIVSKQHLFAALNDATLADGVFLEVDANTVVDQSIHLVWLSSGQVDALSVNQRLLVELGANSKATVVESFANTATGGTAFTNGISELQLGDGAILDHYRLHLEQAEAVHIGGVHATLNASSTLNSFHLALGSTLKRIDIVVEHRGQGAHCEVNGIYLPRGEEQVDYHTCMEHAVPNCTSSETFRGIIADQASAVFNGRIHIHPDAQKTRAELSNKNLLTSNQAEVNTKPELEIYADDVQCAHGATVAQMDPATLHYLRARGISKAEAEVMLSFGFINELVEAIRCEAIRDYLKPLLARRFSHNPKLTRHIL
ncbi:Fe-S cluster assembly protein SufD [Parahaliea sp. F7430]|uniref:Fe-S cluster assembly protein SufD n=1 Tax=Sediminihaliea albiluteola TaxID=2758564 RepID=A0A7W2TWT0_9GAMM|nr:Fe-S cluster assembly protein SufD [Sediminihaliea albiluteola]MBA6413380.1 Fe-S cluster assembly protein SufD [Sediminihaliea albiluteola]